MRPKPPLRVTIEEPEQQETTVIARKETSLKEDPTLREIILSVPANFKIYTSIAEKLKNAVKIDQGITDEEVISKINQSIEEKCGRSVFFALDHKNINVLVAPGYELILTAAEAPRLLTMLTLPRGIEP
ncbi:uncharacterized protein TNCV_4914691 [Trichonephila clavipes]|nr:uncharacterized protein TNCV_4914691 [Trichonephila clavipes]